MKRWKFSTVCSFRYLQGLLQHISPEQRGTSPCAFLLPPPKLELWGPQWSPDQLPHRVTDGGEGTKRADTWLGLPIEGLSGLWPASPPAPPHRAWEHINLSTDGPWEQETGWVCSPILRATTLTHCCGMRSQEFLSLWTYQPGQFFLLWKEWREGKKGDHNMHSHTSFWSRSRNPLPCM